MWASAHRLPARSRWQSSDAPHDRLLRQRRLPSLRYWHNIGGVTRVLRPKSEWKQMPPAVTILGRASCGLVLFLLLSGTFGAPFVGTSGSIVDESFDVGEGPVGGVGERRAAEVNALALQPDGRVIVGGRFTSFNGSACDGVVRLNPDGSVDASFRLGTGQPTDVRALLLEPGGEILVGGFFDGLYGKPCRGLVRLGPDGAVDESFPCNLGPFGSVTALVAQN